MTLKSWIKMIAAIAIVAALMALTSCASTKKDCKGVKHYKQKGGFYL